MKTFILIWVIVQSVLIAAGWVWYFLDRKGKKHKKAPMIMMAIGNFMMAIYFLLLLPMIRK